jgi:hypothetical protein
VGSCPHSFHLACAKAAGCQFNQQEFVLACKGCSKWFKNEATSR